MQILERHLNFVKAVVFSPNDKFLASASSDNRTKFGDLSTGSCSLQTREEYSHFVIPIFLSPDGKLVASAITQHHGQALELVYRATLQTLEGHYDSARALSVKGLVFDDEITGKSWQRIKASDAISGKRGSRQSRIVARAG